MNLITHQRFGWALVVAVACGLPILAAIGCNTAAPPAGGGTADPEPNASLDDLQGEWLYLRVDAEDQQILDAECITIEDDVVSEFADECEGDDLLLSSASITVDGDTFVVRFRVVVTDPDEPAESAEITATVTAEGDIFVGTEETEGGVGGSLQIVLRRPEEG